MGVDGVSSSKYLEDGVYQVESAEQLDEIIQVAQASGRQIAIKDSTSIELFDASKQQLALQRPSLIAASNENLIEFKNLLPSTRTHSKNDSAAEKMAAAVQKKESEVAPVQKAIRPFTEQEALAFMADTREYHDELIKQLTDLSDQELNTAALDTADQLNVLALRAKKIEPNEENLFAARHAHPLGKHFNTTQPEYQELLKERLHQCVVQNRRLPVDQDLPSIVGGCLVDSYSQYIKNCKQKVSDAYQAITGQALDVEGDGFNIYSAASNEQKVETLATTTKIENATKENALCALDEVMGVSVQFVKDAHRSTSLVFTDNGKAPNAYGHNKLSKIVHQLNEFTKGNQKATVALSALMNQSIFEPVIELSQRHHVPGYDIFAAGEARDNSEVHYSADRLPDGNVCVRAERLQSMGMLVLNPKDPTRSGLNLMCKTTPTTVKLDANNWGNRVYCEIVIDHKALDQGEVKVVSHQPYLYQCRFQVNWADTLETMN
jgi:hypothetical protein